MKENGGSPKDALSSQTPVDDDDESPRTFREHLANFREHLGNFREHLANFREHLGNI